MKSKLFIILTLAVFAATCSFSTASMSSLKTSKDKEGKTEATSFKGGETLYANAVISGSMSKTTTRFILNDDKGKAVPGTEVKVDLPSSGTAQYSVPIPAGVPSGKYSLVADFMNDKGEKKDSKSVTVTMEGAPATSAAPAAPATDHKKAADEDDN